MSYLLKNVSRREFLRMSSTTTAAAGLGAPWLLNLSLSAPAAAQAANDYKALVCVFLGGGNDSFNTILATDSLSWTQYMRWRNTGAQPIALPAVGAVGGVLPITPNTSQSSRTFALHPQLWGLVPIFNQGRLAIVSNVAPIRGDLDLRNYNTGVVPQLPAAMFSHSDQSAIWQSQSAAGGAGWGGTMGDLFAAGNGANTIFTSISAAGASGWPTGQQSIGYAASRDGRVKIGLLAGGDPAADRYASIIRRIITRDSSQLFEKQTAAVTRRAIDADRTLGAAILPRNDGGVADPTQIPSGTTLVDNPLAVQLQTVARIIGARATLGLKRQVFFVSLGAFDTHGNQLQDHDYAMLQVNHALSYFDEALRTLGGQDMRGQVTTFTASDFGRTFTSNGSGTDHGFGAHHFVMGGAVRGKDIYGTFPELGVDHERDMGKGILIPQFGVDQYGATLAKWFGVSDGQLTDVFPRLGQFNLRNLGFMT